ncbi:nadh:flavin oxidoreductase [Lasius niger]|uniref:Nadh:flavin oxidoreductase n=1 Tax=Lasius niger TaxID=67767 RepID=A0A0J7NPI3_LASNI|nr:nadh:flavin oxidoreductase [Lasius niger]
MTRGRATREGIPTPIMAQYYAQRCDAGLIISEGVAISPQGYGWINSPGIWNDAQVEAWKPITKAVHDHGSTIVAQLWHMGRMLSPGVTNVPSVAPSAIQPPGVAHGPHGKSDYPTPEALTIPQIHQIVKDYGIAAKNAVKAGFDGIQLHAANGYLVDQFLRDSTNKRKDEYGGSPQKRLRFLKEVVEEMIAAIGAERVSVRFSPNGEIQGCVDSHPEEVFIPAAALLQKLNVAWLELREGSDDASFDMAGQTHQKKLSPEIRKVFHNPLVLNGDYDKESGEEALKLGKADAIAYGRLYINNPDLATRFKENLPIDTDIQPTSFYAAYQEDKTSGYTDYPFATKK